MGTAYVDARSVALRLDRTICMYDGKPVYVQVLRVPDGDWNKVYINALPCIPHNTAQLVDHRDAKFDYRAFLLGYINLKRTAHYLTRVPNRQQKQGLDRYCLVSSPEITDDVDWFIGDKMRDCILGIHPIHDEALDLVLSYEKTSVSISREIAIENASGGLITLLYRGRVVGHRDGDGYNLLPSKERKILQDILQETLKCKIS